MATVAYVGASRIYPGSDTPAVDRLDLDIADGEFLVLVGPSGSGKSTALRMLAGLEDVDAGEIQIDGEDVSDAAPKDRDIAMVFQNYALYPHMTVGDNMGFALKLAGTPKTEIVERVRKAAEMLASRGLTVREVAHRVGYRQPAQFAKAFRRYEGVAPSDFRAARNENAGRAVSRFGREAQAVSDGLAAIDPRLRAGRFGGAAASA